jgi:hypothetical protein
MLAHSISAMLQILCGATIYSRLDPILLYCRERFDV